MARKKPLPALHELESEVMEAVWAHDEVSVREVMEMLNAKASKPRAYTTYMTIMRRLADPGLLERRRVGKTDFYRPAYPREEYAQLRAQAEVDALVDRYGDVALGHFARQIEPILRRACLDCHGKDKQKGDLRLDGRRAAIELGEVIVPGHPEESELVRRIELPRDDEEAMPARRPPLSGGEVELIRAWIRQGAKIK